MTTPRLTRLRMPAVATLASLAGACRDGTAPDGDPPPVAPTQAAYAVYSGASAEAWAASDLRPVPPPPPFAGPGAIVVDATGRHAVAAWDESLGAFGAPARWSTWRPGAAATPRAIRVDELARTDAGTPAIGFLGRPVHVGTNGVAYARASDGDGFGFLAAVDLASFRITRRIARGALFAIWRPAGSTRDEVIAAGDVVRTSLYGDGIVRRVDLVTGRAIDSTRFEYVGTPGERTNEPFVPRTMVLDPVRARMLLLADRTVYACESLARRCRGLLLTVRAATIDTAAADWHTVDDRGTIRRWDADFTVARDSTPYPISPRSAAVSQLRLADGGRAYDLLLATVPASDSVRFGIVRVERGTGRRLVERWGRTVHSSEGGAVLPWVVP